MPQPYGGYIWCDTGILNSDGGVSSPDLLGNEIWCHPDGRIAIIPGGYAKNNTFGLQFTRPDGIEYIIMREILNTDYDSLGLNADSLVLDIGAHVGIVSMTLAKRYGCKVRAYEPAACNYHRLVSNICLNELQEFIIPYNLAVTRDGRQVFIDGDSAQNSGSMMIYHGGKGVPVNSVTLSDIVGEHTIDLLKIDTEGAEYEIFEDLTPLKHVKAIRGEFHTLAGDGFKYTAEPLIKRITPIVPNIVVTT
jgi:FkbM family methyltransferase